MKRLMIPFKGIEQRAKYEDGAMRDLMNLRVRDGVLRVCPNPQVAGSFGDRKVEFMHFHKGWLLYVSGGSLYAVKCGEDYALPEDLVGSSVLVGSVTEGAKVTGLEVLGNLVCVVCDEGVEYALWKDGGYKWLGRFPELVEIQFGRNSNLLEGFAFQDEVHAAANIDTLKGETKGAGLQFQQRLYNFYLKKIKYLEEKEGGIVFTGPVLVRYAYKLFDGSYVMHSCPVLLMPRKEMRKNLHPKRNLGLAYWIKTLFCRGKEPFSFEYYTIYGSVNFDSSIRDTLKKWSDIIVGVSFFVSDGLMCGEENVPEGAKERLDLAFSYSSFGSFEPAWQMIELHVANYDETQEIRSCGTFYKLYDMNINELLDFNEQRKSFNLSSGEVKYSSDLKHQEIMSNAGYSHHRVSGMKSYVFNNRLRFGDVREVLYKGHGRELGLLEEIGAGTDVERIVFNGTSYSRVKKTDDSPKLKAIVCLRIDGVGYKVTRYLDNIPFSAYLSYPDPRAYSMDFYYEINGQNSFLWSFKLKPHPTLDIAYYLGYHDGYEGAKIIEFALKKMLITEDEN